MARSLLHIPRRIVKTALLAVLMGVVFFFAATRTEVGRDELRQELERQFADRYAGTLRIGALEGNLVNDLFASDVRLLDPDGRTVLTIDSVVARPRWQALLGQQFAFRSLSLHQPRLALHRRADRTWNLRAALARSDTARRSTVGMPDLALADLRIHDGTITTTREGPVPSLAAREWLFDYTQARLTDLQANVTVEWSPEDELVDVFDFSAALPKQDVRIEQFQGQLLGDGEQLTLNQIRLRTEDTDLAFDATLARPDALTDPAPEESTPEMALDLAASRISFGEMRRLMPRLPLDDAATVEAEIRGPLSGLVVESFEVDRGDSHLTAEGTVLGLPDHADFELALQESRLTAADVRALLPSAPVPAFEGLGPVDLSLYSKGLLPFDADTLDVEATTELALQSRAGAVEGTLHLAQHPEAPLAYGGQFRADSLNLQPLVRASAYASALSGTVQIDGHGIDPASARGRLNATLAPSSFAGQPIDSMQVTLRADAGLFRTDAQLWQPQRGYLRAEGDLDLLQSRPTYYLTLATHDFNLQDLPFARLPATRLNGRVTTRGAGFSLAEAAGRLSVELDSSSIDYRGQTHLIPPHRTDLTIADRTSNEPRIELTGDVATLRVDGDVAFKPLWALGNLWGRSMVRAARHEIDKPYHQPLVSADAHRPTDASPTAPFDALMQRVPDPPEAAARWQRRARRALAESGYPSDLTVQASFSVKRAGVLEALMPLFPTLDTDLRGRVTVTAGADRLDLQSHVESEVFTIENASATRLTAQLQATGDLQRPLTEAFTADLGVHGAQARLGPVELHAPQLTFDYRDRQAALRFTSEKNRRTGPFQLAVTADLLPDRNELTVHDVQFVADEHAWTSTHPSTLHAYRDVLVIPDFLLESAHPDAEQTQRLRVRGTFSDLPRDTVVVEADSVLLQPFSELARLQRPIGGVLNGALTLTGSWEAPRVHSTVDVNWLSLGRRLLGRLQLTSRYTLGAPDLQLAAALHTEDDASAAPSYLPYRPSRTEENHLTVQGRIRLSDAAEPAAEAADRFDLQLNVERADLFFFEYIFEETVENVSGYVTGRGQIRGSLRRPRFSADLYAVDGRFDLPEFNLRYDLDGPISVDDDGINLNGVTVHDPDDGAATVTGTVLFNAYEYFSFDLHAELDELRIIDVQRSQDLPFYGRISASGPVSLTGPLAGATLRASDARTTPDSELFIPVQEDEIDNDTGFLIFADSTGQVPDFRQLVRRSNILDERPQGEPTFLDALDLDINLRAPAGSTVNLVFDPLLGDVVTAVGEGRVQIQRQEGEFYTYGTLEVNSGEYLFTAGEVFVRRFTIDGGTITWDGSPTNALLDLDASYRTRASTAGLPNRDTRQRIPVIIQLDITGRVETPRVGLNLAVDSRDRNASFTSETLASLFNQPNLVTDDRATEYATSVLLTNTFLLTTSSVGTGQPAQADTGDRLTNAGNQLAFNSVSQLVASQLNRYLNAALPNLDVNFGVQGQDPQDLDVIYGVALRLLDERLIIRGEGIYQGDEARRQRTEGLEGEFVVEVRLSSNVSVEAFHRRTGDELLDGQTLTSTTGAGLSYQTEFTTWRNFFRRLLNWLIPGRDDEPPSDDAPSPPDTLAAEPRQRP